MNDEQKMSDVLGLWRWVDGVEESVKDLKSRIDELYRKAGEALGRIINIEKSLDRHDNIFVEASKSRDGMLKRLDDLEALESAFITPSQQLSAVGELVTRLDAHDDHFDTNARQEGIFRHNLNQHTEALANHDDRVAELEVRVGMVSGLATPVTDLEPCPDCSVPNACDHCETCQNTGLVPPLEERVGDIDGDSMPESINRCAGQDCTIWIGEPRRLCVNCLKREILAHRD